MQLYFGEKKEKKINNKYQPAKRAKCFCVVKYKYKINKWQLLR